ncbi:ABC transporter substrate-binding protein [Arthrobacter sp. R4]|uniref:ABC transporter substrate-binding protein n=1 Tax=Arthrobacter sp. R4 TaxID=644417 RepID=UPI003ED8C58A
MNAMKRFITGAAAVSLAASLAACGGGPAATPAGPSADPGVEGTDSQPVTLNYWGWKKGTADQVKLFNAAHKNVQIKYTEVKGGSDALNGLRNAASAGNAPDLQQGNQDWMVPLVAEKVAADVTPWLSPSKDKFRESAYKASQVNDHNYVVPTEQAPQFFVYQKPIYDAANLSAPKTMDEFVDQGKVLAGQGHKITNMAGEDPSTLVNWAWQAGAQWYKADGDTWKINFLDRATMEAADVTQKLIDEGAISTQTFADYAAVQQMYDKGNTATRHIWTWSTNGMVSNFKESFGNWAAAPIPEFSTGGNANVSPIGGIFVTEQSKSKKAAAEAAVWLATEKESVTIAADPIKGASSFPVIADSDSYVSTLLPEKLFGANHAEAVKVAVEASKNIAPDWTYGPNYTAMYTELADGWARVITKQQKVTDLLKHMQEWTINDLKKKGINAADGSV